ncbi:MAG: NADH-quinone oxidoreductase subunit N [Phycisphaerales bacterium]
MLPYMLPECAMFVGTCLTMVVGLSRDANTRNQTWMIVFATLLVAGLLASNTPPADSVFPYLIPFSKGLIAIVGIMLMLLGVGTVDRAEEAAVAQGRPYDALRMNRAEFWALFLFSLTGAMLVPASPNLIWLFLALELTSLPTYVMVVMSTRGTRSQEAGVKYFFLGALGAAMFLYGFALIYGGTGSTNLNQIAATFAAQSAAGGINDIAAAGVLLAIVGVAFKIAAVPMHFYTADVYQGASSPISAFLAFVPKTAGFITLLLLVGTLGWSHVGGHSAPGGEGGAGSSLPEFARITLWVLAAITMTVGNTLALIQSSVKRILAYSSVAHSGYMLVGLVVGPGSEFTSSGVAAVLFYLLCYGVMNLGVFAVLACLEHAPKDADADPAEADHIDDIRGLCRTRPLLGWCMVICSLSLLGLPFTLGFWGKLPLFTAGISAGEIVLVIILGLNSAVAAFYYLRLAAVPLLESRDDSAPALRDNPFWARRLAAMLSAGGVLSLVFLANGPMESSLEAGTYVQAAPARGSAPTPAAPAEHHNDHAAAGSSTH